MEPFALRLSAHYERLSSKLSRRHSTFAAVEQRAFAILAVDPLNLARQHHIKKLEDVAAGGVYRLALGRWRFLYDVAGRVVEVHYCGLRREDTY